MTGERGRNGRLADLSGRALLVVTTAFVVLAVLVAVLVLLWAIDPPAFI